MKIRTNAGEVELTAEMVCKGMVFNDPKDGPYVLVSYDHYAEAWTTDSPGTRTETNVAIAHAFLGCDPTIASRVDCERFGVHGDAAAHGFARIPSGGALDLRNAENVRKGMLFRTGGRDVTAACDGQFALDDDARNVVFIGCHPALARREDCERFGIPERCEQFGVVAPLDAAAHGFARLRDGGAVDLRRAENLRTRMVFFANGRRHLLTVPWAGGETQNIWRTAYGTLRLDGTGDARFVGLNADHASPEDVRRLCCGDQPTTWTEPPMAPGEKRWIKRPTCTLAIGEHEQHEDLATGVKWGASSGVDIAKAHIRASLDSAKGHFFTGSPDSIRRVLAACDLRALVHRLAPESYRVTLEGADAVLCDAVARWLSDNCPADVIHEVVATSAEPSTDSAYLQEIPKSTKHSPPTVRATWTGIAGLPLPPPDRFVFHDGDPVREVVSIQANAYHCECGAETPSDHAGTCKAPFWIREASLAAWCEWRQTGDVSAASKACYEARVGAGVVSLLAWVYRLWAASPEGKRAAQERALVALVNAVPEGLDPIGWRAAVLACHEFGNTAKMAIFVRDEDGEQISIERQLRENVDYTIAGEHAVRAYRRAITPAAPVPRVRTTWKTRGPVLDVDDGRDE